MNKPDLQIPVDRIARLEEGLVIVAEILLNGYADNGKLLLEELVQQIRQDNGKSV